MNAKRFVRGAFKCFKWSLLAGLAAGTVALYAWTGYKLWIHAEWTGLMVLFTFIAGFLSFSALIATLVDLHGWAHSSDYESYQWWWRDL